MAAEQAVPASTVALLRDGADGIETLLLRRSEQLAFAPNRWVFPGGRLDPGDFTAAGESEEQAARIGAAREAREECAQQPDPESMVLLSRWTTPRGHTRRFSTYIFAAPMGTACEVQVDGEEINAHQWLSAEEALAMHRRGSLEIMPPTMITLRLISLARDVRSFLNTAAGAPVPEVSPVLCKSGAGLVSLYPGDAGYETEDPAVSGARHRAALVDGEWVYRYEGVDAAFPPLIPRT